MLIFYVETRFSYRQYKCMDNDLLGALYDTEEGRLWKRIRRRRRGDDDDDGDGGGDDDDDDDDDDADDDDNTKKILERRCLNSNILESDAVSLCE